MKMNPETRDKWVAALLSGDYAQCRNELRSLDEKSHCCLGVLIDVTLPGEWDNTDNFSDTSLKDLGKIPRRYRENDLLQLHEDDEETLVRMNDDNDADFAEIAGWIKENL